MLIFVGDLNIQIASNFGIKYRKGTLPVRGGRNDIDIWNVAKDLHTDRQPMRVEELRFGLKRSPMKVKALFGTTTAQRPDGRGFRKDPRLGLGLKLFHP